MSGRPTDEAVKRKAAGTFVLCAVWLLALLFVSVVLLHLAPGEHAPVLRAGIQLLLTLAGFYWIAVRRVKDLRPLSAVGLVQRPSMWREAGLGIALGWAVAVLLVLPALLTRNLHTLLAFDANHASQTIDSVALELLVATLTPAIFQGLAFRSLVRATSGTLAALSVAAVSGALILFTPGHDAGMALFAAVASLILSVAALRTRAIWMATGILVGWGLALNVVFGVGSFYWPTVSGVVTSYVTGPRWLTGSMFGPEASLWGLVVAFVALAAAVRLTRDYAWHYNHDPIVAAGYAMDIAPPQEHVRMEEAARTAAPLVQIQPAGTSQPPA